MKPRKGEGVLQNVIFTLLLVGFVGVAVGLFAGQLVGNYGGTFDDTQLDGFDKISETTNTIYDISEEVQGTDEDSNFFQKALDVIDRIFTAGFRSILLIFQVFDSYTGIFTALGSIIGLPPAVTGLAVTSILLVIAFGVIALLFKVNP